MAKKILIIEDEEVLLELLTKKLKNLGYEVFFSTDGAKGLELVREIVPDLILLDIVLPSMGGFEILEEIRSDEALKPIPVIIVSNSGQPVEIDKARELEAQDWLIKTEFDPQEVVEKVIKQIGQPNE